MLMVLNTNKAAIIPEIDDLIQWGAITHKQFPSLSSRAAILGNSIFL